jgi:hypothetical protein
MGVYARLNNYLYNKPRRVLRQMENNKERLRCTTPNMALAKAGVQSELQPFVLLINFGAVREVKCF